MERSQLTLYGITDRKYLNGITLPDAVEKALQGGVTILQIREKVLDEDALRREIRQILPICRRYGVPLILDDHVELAVETGCDGVHIGQNDMPATGARAILGSDRILGVTAKTVEQAMAAEKAGADYLGSGAMFPTGTKSGALPMSRRLLREITASVHIPVVAIGGISVTNAALLRGTGIAGIAVSEGIFEAEDIREAAAALRRETETL